MTIKTLKQLLFRDQPSDQEVTEAFIALATLLYKADGHVREAETELLEEMVANLHWENATQGAESFHSRIIGEVNVAISSGKVKAFIAKYCGALAGREDVIAQLKSLSEVDGVVDEREAFVLEKIEEYIADYQK